MATASRGARPGLLIGAGGGGGTKLTRRRWLAVAGAAAGLSALGSAPAFARQATPVATPLPAARDWRAERWVGTWAAAPHAPFPGFEDFPSQVVELDDQTVRQVVRASVGGDRLRVRLANTYGDVPLVVGAARVARHEADERVVAASDRVLTFGGRSAVTIPAGAAFVSDPVDLGVPALGELAVSLYLPEPIVGTTTHGLALRTTYLSPAGDFTGEAAMPVASTAESWLFLSGVEVAGSDAGAVVATLGDSITDGAGASAGGYHRWPDVLAERLAADAAGGAVAVLNEGIGGNRLLHDGAGDLRYAFGAAALARFDRDVLALPGLTHLIVLEGINDIGVPLVFGSGEEVSAGEIIGGLWQLVERAHGHGIAAIGGTLTPVGGSFYGAPEAEAKRQEVNAWIRSGGAFDAVIDFEAAVRDPDRPAQLLPEYDSGDHLHPSDAGYRAMGEAIDLALFRSSGG